jgi:hypothetical protein
MGWGVGSAERDMKHFKHAFDISQYIVVPKSDDAIPVCFEPSGAHFIARIVRVLATIEFDDKTRFRAKEIDDVIAKRMLPPEAKATELLVAYTRPQASFGLGKIGAQAACNWRGHMAMVSCRATRGDPPSHPSPSRGEGAF